MASVTSGNPALSDRVVGEYLVASREATGTMTVAGTAVKTGVLLVVLLLGGAWGWSAANVPISRVDAVTGYANTTVTIPGGFWLASIGAFLVGIMVATNPRRGALLGPVYAVLEGFVLGAISAVFDAQTDGIVAAAITGTACVFLVALVLYATRIVRPTAKMAFGVTAAIGGLALLYLFVWILAIFDWSFLYSEEFRTMGIIVSLISVVLAALSFTLDFGAIEAGVAAGAPKFMEWYAAYALTVTLVWLYVTLLRLLAWLSRSS